jgi:hypothetical protein
VDACSIIIVVFSVPIEYLKLNTFFLNYEKNIIIIIIACIFGKWKRINGYLHGVTGSLVLKDKIE